MPERAASSIPSEHDPFAPVTREEQAEINRAVDAADAEAARYWSERMRQAAGGERPSAE